MQHPYLITIPSQPYCFPILRYPYEIENEVRNDQEIQKDKISNIEKNFDNDIGITDKKLEIIKPAQFGEQRVAPENFGIRSPTLNAMIITDTNVNPHVVELMEQSFEKERIETDDKIMELGFRKHKAETGLAEIKLSKKQRKI